MLWKQLSALASSSSVFQNFLEFFFLFKDFRSVVGWMCGCGICRYRGLTVLTGSTSNEYKVGDNLWHEAILKHLPLKKIWESQEHVQLLIRSSRQRSIVRVPDYMSWGIWEAGGLYRSLGHICRERWYTYALKDENFHMTDSLFIRKCGDRTCRAVTGFCDLKEHFLDVHF